MADLNAVNIESGNIGVNTVGNDDGLSAILIPAPTADNLAHNVTKTIFNPQDAIALGITEDFDDTNDINAYRHISEFYRMRGEGQKVFVMLVPQATTMVAALNDATMQMARKLLVDAEGQVRQLAVVANPTGATVPLNGLPDDVYNAIPAAQGLYNWANEKNMPLSILLEGYDYQGAAATAADLRAIPDLQADKVSVIIGQDFDYASGLTGNAKKFADVGTALGVLSACSINQNIGDNEAFDLTDVTKNAWKTAGLSNNTTINDNFNDLQALEDKGYIFAMKYNLPGFRFNNDHTCTPIIIDAEGNVNEHTIAYGRTHDKVRRELRKRLLPKVKTKQPVDPKTGKLPIGVVKYFEGLGDDLFDEMVAATELSAGKTYVDPDSNLIVDKVLKVKFRAVPYGNVGEIKGTSNLKTNL